MLKKLKNSFLIILLIKSIFQNEKNFIFKSCFKLKISNLENKIANRILFFKNCKLIINLLFKKNNKN